jgi:CheY-like chemotaxis protein
LEHGAFAYLVKPLTTEELEAAFDRILEFAKLPVKRLLVVEDNEIERQSVIELIDGNDVRITAVGTGAEALEALRTKAFDCMVLDLRLPDISGFVLLEQIHQEASLRELPIVVFTGKELTGDEEMQLRKMAKSIIIKGVQSPERLLDETALFLHRITTNLPPAKQKMLERLHQTDETLAGKKVLVVDDDVRNIFVLTSLLERHSMKVVSCETGREAIAIVEQDPDLNMVLMDIMMPEMDGYETMRAIRRNPRHQFLPIIALTAKAMKGDREKCLEAGASDYIAKPVNTDQLLSLMRVWLHR